MNEETLTTYGAPLLALAVGWLVRHFNLGGIALPTLPTPTPAPVPAPTPSPLEQRLDLLEKQLAAILAAFLQKPTTPTPTP